MSWSHQTVLITGAGGFIGSHLTERLVGLGARTRALVHYNSGGSWGWLDSSPIRAAAEVIQGDVRDSSSLRIAMRGVDTVFHLAALISIPYSYHTPMSFIRTNVEGTLNVLEEALAAGVQRVVHTSTSEVYGTAQYVPMDERHPLRAQSPYAASKIGADTIAQSFHLSYGLPVSVIRPFNTYGPRQSARAVIPNILVQALTTSVVKLGSLDPRRDFNYVADIVDGFVLIAESPGAIGRVINVGSGTDVSIGQLAEAIVALLGAEIAIVSESQRIRPAESEVGRLCAESRLAQAVLGWQPRHTLEEGLSRTVEWIKSNLERYRVDVYAV